MSAEILVSTAMIAAQRILDDHRAVNNGDPDMDLSYGMPEIIALAKLILEYDDAG